jgi:hypothetical protein
MKHRLLSFQQKFFLAEAKQATFSNRKDGKNCHELSVFPWLGRIRSTFEKDGKQLAVCIERRILSEARLTGKVAAVVTQRSSASGLSIVPMNSGF